MRRMVKRRWKSKFARFIQAYGVESLALALDVRPSAIYHWVRAVTTPRPAHAEIIQRLARERGFRLTMDEIYSHSRTVRADEIKIGTRATSEVRRGSFPLPTPVAGKCKRKCGVTFSNCWVPVPCPVPERKEFPVFLPRLWYKNRKKFRGSE
jgi:hypothetical protein